MKKDTTTPFKTPFKNIIAFDVGRLSGFALVKGRVIYCESVDLGKEHFTIRLKNLVKKYKALKKEKFFGKKHTLIVAPPHIYTHYNKVAGQQLNQYIGALISYSNGFTHFTNETNDYFWLRDLAEEGVLTYRHNAKQWLQEIEDIKNKKQRVLAFLKVIVKYHFSRFNVIGDWRENDNTADALLFLLRFLYEQKELEGKDDGINRKLTRK